MKIRMEEDPSAEDLEITIRCRQTNEQVIRILEMLDGGPQADRT